MAATLAGGALAQRLMLPNAFVLGSLAVAIPLTAAQVNLSATPTLASNAGQCLLGCALGARFERDFLRGAPRFVGAVRATRVGAIVLSAARSVLAARAGRTPPGDGRARDGARRDRRDVDHREGAAARRAARHRVPRDAPGRAAALTAPLFARVRAWRRARAAGQRDSYERRGG